MNVPMPVASKVDLKGLIDAIAQTTAEDSMTNPLTAAQWEVLRFSMPGQLARYVVEKGSITVDGVSLTVAAVTDESFSVGLIPTTLDRTVLGRKQVGDPVNLEADVMAKYVERLLAGAASDTGEGVEGMWKGGAAS